MNLVTSGGIVDVRAGIYHEDVNANNRLRRELTTALAALKLLSPDRAVRFAAAKDIAGGAEDAMLPLVKKALANETDPELKPMLEMIQASIEMKSTDRTARLNAIRMLGQSNNANAKTLLLAALEKNADGKYIETDEEIYVEAQRSLRTVEARLAWGERVGVMFSGVSLGSILLLAALGLAITYGLMGVINMAHGELIMIGAYTTYVIQNLFKTHAPGLFDWYLACAVPGAFLAGRGHWWALGLPLLAWLPDPILPLVLIAAVWLPIIDDYQRRYTDTAMRGDTSKRSTNSDTVSPAPRAS